MTNDEIADVLEGAADALFVHGRTQTIGYRTDGTMCALGAIRLIENDGERDSSFLYYPVGINVDTFGRYLQSSGRTFMRDVVAAVWAWNDDTDDDGEVIDTFKACAKDLRRSEVPE